MTRLRSQLTYANVISTVCLVLLVGGGTAFAATQMLPKNSVGARQLKKGAVTPAKLNTAAKTALAGRPGPQGPQGAKGAQGEKGDVGPRGPSNAYYAFRNTNGGESNSVSLTVPAGSYVVSGSMYATLTAGYAEIDCGVVSSTGGANEGSVVLTLPPPPPGAAFTYAHPQAETALTVTGGGGTLTFACHQIGGTATTTDLYQQRIVATRVESLTTS